MDADVWLVHATDPHLFEKPSTQSDQVKKASEEVARKTQEEGNREAFLALLKTLGALPGAGDRADHLVITGDFGFGEDPASAAGAAQGGDQAASANTQTGGEAAGSQLAEEEKQEEEQEVEPAAQCTTDTRAGRMKCVIDVLANSPVREIYVVPGNNDVEKEDPGQLSRAHAFFAKVQEKQPRVLIHDLTRCYVGNAPRSQCWADVPDTSFRLVGFPSHSFKNKIDKTDLRKVNEPQQTAQMKLFGELLQDAGRAGKKVLVVTHIAEMDDPYLQARWKFAKQRPVPADYTWQEWSAWNVSPALQQQWAGLIRSDTVAGVLAGHFHDSHREIYRWPRAWASGGLNRTPLEKVMLAPPLAVKLQDGSPFQARGFALIGLQGDELKRRLVWYNPVRKGFDAEPAPRTQRARAATAPDVVAWLWNLPAAPGLLGRAVVIAIAFLAAFLTVVEVWQIPPPDTRATMVAGGTSTSNAGATTTTTTTTSASGSTTPPPHATYGGMALLFTSNLARTVLSGLAGLALVSTFNSLWKANPQGYEEPYYLILFVLFFIVGLFLSAVWRGATEAIRSRISIARRFPQKKDAEVGGYWTSRFWHWVTSLRIPLLVFMDTAFNVIQGRNQSRTVAFENEIANLHESIISAVDRIRGELDDAFEDALGKEQASPDARVRVNVSLLSRDEKRLFYISREAGSLFQGFGEKSFGWLAAMTGRPFWWTKDFPEDTVLLDNQTGAYPGVPKETLYLKNYFESRVSSDYQAFMVLPAPWGLRGTTSDFRRAVIHVSFCAKSDFDSIWSGLPDTTVSDKEAWKGVIEPKGDKEDTAVYLEKAELSPVLHRATSLLGDLLRHFNDILFEEYVRPRLKPQ